MADEHDDDVCGTESMVWDPSEAACQEDGWRCLQCDGRAGGEPPGYRPDLDRPRIVAKVTAILMALHDSGLVYISNGSDGESLVSEVAGDCRRVGLFDQYSILWFIMRCLAPSHGDFWNRIGEGVMGGKDPRDRCWCGALAKGSSGTDKWCSWEHRRGDGGLLAVEEPW